MNTALPSTQRHEPVLHKCGTGNNLRNAFLLGTKNLKLMTENF
jgi:hypothetical protein